MSSRVRLTGGAAVTGVGSATVVTVGIGVSAATVGMVGLSSLQVHSQTNTTQHTMVMRATRRCRLILRARRHLRE